MVEEKEKIISDISLDWQTLSHVAIHLLLLFLTAAARMLSLTELIYTFLGSVFLRRNFLDIFRTAKNHSAQVLEKIPLDSQKYHANDAPNTFH